MKGSPVYLVTQARLFQSSFLNSRTQKKTAILVASTSSKSLQSDAPHHASLRFLLRIIVIKGFGLQCPLQPAALSLATSGTDLKFQYPCAAVLLTNFSVVLFSFKTRFGVLGEPHGTLLDVAQTSLSCPFLLLPDGAPCCFMPGGGEVASKLISSLCAFLALQNSAGGPSGWLRRLSIGLQLGS